MTEAASEAALIGTGGGIAAESVETPMARAIRRFKRRRGALLALIVIAIFVGAAVLAPMISPYDPDVQTWTAVRKAPSALHWFGTDDVGRDVLLACPFLILAIALAAFLGPSLGNAMIAIGITTTPIFIRLTRGQVMAVKVEDYVEAARAVGNPHWRIALVHILPNILPALLVQATLSIAAAIIAEAALSFLGLGQQPPAPSWGSMLNAAQRFLVNAPWMAIWPGLAIFLTVLSFNLVGDGLRDALDPRSR